MRHVSDELKKILEKNVLTESDLARIRSEIPELRRDVPVLTKDPEPVDLRSLMPALFDIPPAPPIPYVREVKVKARDKVMKLRPGEKFTVGGVAVTFLEGYIYDEYALIELGSDDPALLEAQIEFD